MSFADTPVFASQGGQIDDAAKIGAAPYQSCRLWQKKIFFFEGKPRFI
jgi:hypothetical protein